MTLDDLMWADLRSYYELHGTGWICCCPVSQYSSEIVFYDDLDHQTVEPVMKRFLRVAVHKALAKFKTDVELYRMEIVCSPRRRVPLLFGQVVCMFVLEDKKIILSDQMTDFLVDDEDKLCIEVYFMKTRGYS